MKRRTKRTVQKFFPLLLTSAILLITRGIAVQAETAGANGATGKQEKELPSNPVHHCTKEKDGKDDTDWSYVYFGSYPQAEVTGNALTEAITGASYDVTGDAWVDGIRYRRIGKGNTNYDGYFGDSGYRYFKWEKIKWRVLQNDGSTLFVIADKGLDCKNYNEEKGSVIWEGSTLREWLNSSFYHTAFRGEEQEMVVGQSVANGGNPEYGTEGGGNTEDKVYLLSMEEMTDPSYGFCGDGRMDSVSRRMEPSDYARARGAFLSSGEYPGCWWWLRSSGYDTTYTVSVSDSGYVFGYGMNASTSSNAVVPTVHIDLTSGVWSLVDDGGSGEVRCTKHNWDGGVVTKAPTCAEEGEEECTCTICGETRRESLAKLSHTYKIIVVKAKADKDGSVTEQCEACGDVKSRKIIPYEK